MDSTIHRVEVDPFETGGSYAYQVEGTHPSCSHKGKTWKHML